MYDMSVARVQFSKREKGAMETAWFRRTTSGRSVTEGGKGRDRCGRLEIFDELTTDKLFPTSILSFYTLCIHVHTTRTCRPSLASLFA